MRQAAALIGVSVALVLAGAVAGAQQVKDGSAKAKAKADFVAKDTLKAGVKGGGKGKDLQGHVPVKGSLLGFVHDPHAPPADFPEDAEVSESA